MASPAPGLFEVCAVIEDEQGNVEELRFQAVARDDELLVRALSAMKHADELDLPEIDL